MKVAFFILFLSLTWIVKRSEQLSEEWKLDGVVQVVMKYCQHLNIKDHTFNVLSTSVSPELESEQALSQISFDTMANHNVAASNYQVDVHNDHNEFWTEMRKQRTRFLGSLNLVVLDTQDLTTYLNTLHHRFFTGYDENNEIGKERRMDLIFFNIHHIFLFDDKELWLQYQDKFEALLEESINCIVVTFGKQDQTTEVWYSRSDPLGLNQMKLVNEYSLENGFRVEETLFPPVEKVYWDMKGRELQHPVMHKPPWNFVTYDENNVFVEDNGGRDITLTDILAHTMNFTYISIDPLDHGIKRSRGSRWKTPDFNFTGINGKIHRREDPFHFYLGDTTQTYTRNTAVYYTYVVLFDAGAYITKAPKKIIPPDIILKPFSLPVWVFMIVGFFVSWFGCIFVIGMSRTRPFYYHHPVVQVHRSLGSKDKGPVRLAFHFFFYLLKTVVNEHGCRETVFDDTLIQSKIIAAVWLMVCSLVLYPSYNGSLFSFFYIPFSEPVMDTIEDVYQRQQINFTIAVKPGSSSYGILATGGGIYSKIWETMEEQDDWAISNFDDSFHRVLSDPNYAILAGREKLIYDAIRLGKEKFHINKDIFFPKYKGIVIRNGSPFRAGFNKIIHRLMESGLIDKITSDEYNGLVKRKGKYGWRWNNVINSMEEEEEGEEEEKTIRLGLKHLQGSFWALLLGSTVSLLTFIIELCSLIKDKDVVEHEYVPSRRRVDGASNRNQ